MSSETSIISPQVIENSPSRNREAPEKIVLNNINDIQQFYKFEEKIGQGTFGKVYKACSLMQNEEIRAIKFGNKLDANSKGKFEQEAYILRLTNHSNIIKVYEVFETRKYFCLALEYCLTDLRKAYKQYKPFGENLVRKILLQISSALQYLHSNGIVHRDLKLSNILLTENPKDSKDVFFCKVSDFGLAGIRKGFNYESLFKSTVGTPKYMAPELAKHAYSHLCDIWSLGVIFYVLLFGKYPYEVNSIENIEVVIKENKINFDLIPCGEATRDLLKMCLEENPAMRINAKEILNHPFITKKVSSAPSNILSLMNEFNKKTRKF